MKQTFNFCYLLPDNAADKPRRKRELNVAILYPLYPPFPLHVYITLLMRWWDVWLPWFQTSAILCCPAWYVAWRPHAITFRSGRCGWCRATCTVHRCVCLHTDTHTHKLRVPAQHCVQKVACATTKTAAVSCSRGERLPVDSLRNAPGQPRYQPISGDRGPMQEAGADSQALWGNTISSYEDKRGAGRERLSHSYLSLSFPPSFCLCLSPLFPCFSEASSFFSRSFLAVMLMKERFLSMISLPPLTSILLKLITKN